MFFFFFIISVIAIVIHVFLMKERSAKKIVGVILMYLLAINVGLSSIVSGVFHVFDGPATAARIGWAPGSPFQYEVGVADMAMGLVAFLCLFIRGTFWLAAIIAESFFLLACMIGHVHSLYISGNLAAYNIGPNIILSDLVMPLVLIGLYIIYKRMK
ncbi:MAG: hypothetical protein KKB81_01415 [Candidatus Margulisbacteria bacterium]|nr:hypothetical protein [Candidatus Margulisiibacteriota bacterium]MBU1021573.1 hypothetical protein [Candidatus Margulisiibacteriota bacterium]MBU1728724.1 hypothetical protein [Candidatus Margulisiibacteriota bacterium]MBU1955175.1 hypothetical protein [Candidatus Margulisiibacteriota bacterium]